MKIGPSFLPPVVKQPSLSADEGGTQNFAHQPTPEAIEKNADKAPLIVGEVETVLEQAQARREIIDLRAFKEAPLPLNNLRALSSYLTVASGPDESTGGLARLDIIV